jgi:hypothetical protein
MVFTIYATGLAKSEPEASPKGNNAAERTSIRREEKQAENALELSKQPKLTYKTAVQIELKLIIDGAITSRLVIPAGTPLEITTDSKEEAITNWAGQEFSLPWNTLTPMEAESVDSVNIYQATIALRPPIGSKKNGLLKYLKDSSAPGSPTRLQDRIQKSVDQEINRKDKVISSGIQSMSYTNTPKPEYISTQNFLIIMPNDSNKQKYRPLPLPEK